MTTVRATHCPTIRLPLLALAIVTAVSAPPAIGQDDPPPQIPAAELTDRHILLAIDAIVEELYRRKHEQRFWDPKHWTYNTHGDENQSGGYTALCALSLLYAGQSYQDPRLRDAIDYLHTFGMSGTYAVALRAHIWAHLPQKYKPDLAADHQWLIDGFSERVRGWGYSKQPNASRQDHSLRQYGALGLWEAAKRGVHCDARYWRMLEQAYIDSQLADGGWNYRADSSPPRGSMTAAGLTVLFITQDLLHANEAVKLPRQGQTRHQRAIDLGMQWMTDNFSPTHNPGRDADFYYYLYGVERVGLASGYRYFGEHDWFRDGAAELIRRLCDLDEQTGEMAVHQYIAGVEDAGLVRNHHLAFALMFLSRGRSPISINKLKVEDYNWNNRPRDVANLNSLISDATETQLNWQIVDFAHGPRAWLDAPLLYLASDQPLPWLDEVRVNPRRRAVEYERLLAEQAHGEQPVNATVEPALAAPLESIRAYLDRGGFILAVNEGSNRSFARSIEEAGQLLYPQYQWRTLPDDHWAYTLSPVDGRRIPLRGLSNGVRELIILSPTDLSRTFQSPSISEPAQEQITTNIYFYASEFAAPKPRLDALTADALRDDAPAGRMITIARALYDGTWSPEPQALQRWEAARAERDDLAVRIEIVPLQQIHSVEPRPEIVVLCGTDAHELTEKEQAAIRAYLESGGLIICETVGGVGSFTAEMEQAVETMLGAAPKSLLRHPIITGEGVPGAADLTRVEYRPFALETFGVRETTPRLRAVFVDGEPRVIFSRDDLSHALLDQPCWGVSGYTAESARALLTNIAQYVAATGSVQ